jgi:tetratricopeptide (TPR) repeat protein
LIQFAEQAFFMRDLDALEEASRVLMNFPIDSAWQIGLYYHALAINRKGQKDKAENLLNSVGDTAPATYRARAIQTLGSIYHYNGQFDETLRFQYEALRVASDKNAHGLQTALLAYWEISIIKSLDGDHKGALSDLKSLSPLVNLLTKQKPFYFYSYCNALSVELGELGRIEEAEAACKVALASPFASAYPEWAETRQELEAKRTSATPSIVAINRGSEAAPSPEVGRQRQPQPSRALTFGCPASDRDSFQRSVIPIPARATTAFSAISILNRIGLGSGGRAARTDADKHPWLLHSGRWDHIPAR